jgi:hypothetical protein
MAINESVFRAAVERMLNVFSGNAAHLFEQTKAPHFRTYYKGVYGITYVKPSRPIRQLLAVDREVLVLSTTFSDLQPRINQLAIEIIDGSDGRLERTVAIVLHKDPGGNNKLKNWGRDVGLTVIPLHFATDALPTGDVLERTMLSEFFSHDPYDVTGPVSDDSMFFGRRDEAQDLARQLQQGQVRACLGIRKIGKTSVLHRVLAVLESYHDCFSVVVDCSKDAVWSMSAAQLLMAIGEAVGRACDSEDFCAEVEGIVTVPGLPEAYSALIQTLRSAQGTVVLMFDEVDYITPGSPTAEAWAREFNPFWRNLRAAHQELARTDATLSVLISGVSSKWFSVEQVGGVENAALAFLPDEYLAPLPMGASIAMIRQLGRTSGLVISESAAAIIAETCGNMPFWIRKAGSFIHQNTDVAKRPLQLDDQRVRVLCQAFVANEGASIAEVAITHLFRVYPDLRPVAEACLAGDASKHSRFLIAALHRYGIISTPSAYPTISGAMVSEGLQLSLERYAEGERAAAAAGASEPITGGLRFETMSEWAEELAVIGAMRNKAEKKMRFLVLNFLRFDALSNKQKGTLSERLLRIIDDKRRPKLEALTPDEVIEKFNWTDLIALIERDWSLFSGVFHDKVQLTAAARVVNDRYDAHAKDADRADLAVYRRSVSWFADALARV